MILAKKSAVVFFVIVSVLLFFLLAFFSYRIIISSSSFSGETLKFYAERIFLAGIAGGFLIFLAGTGMILKSYRFGKSLEKLLVMSRNTGYSPDAGLRKLGKTGMRIAEILSEMNRIGELRAIRISSLDNLCRKIMNTSDRSAAVVSPTLEIKYCTKRFAEKYAHVPGSEPESMAGHVIDAFVKDRDMKAMVDGAVLSRKEIRMSDGIIYPVLDSRNEVSYCFCLFNASPGGISLAALKETAAYHSIAAGGGKIRKVFDFIKKRKKQ